MHPLPNTIIAGVNKAGTTSLFTYLAQHPAVCAATIKETGYFLTHRYAEPPHPWAEYTAHFAHCRNRPVILEATPGYYYGGQAVTDALHEQLGSLRIILIFRDPVARLISFFKSQKALLRFPPEMTLADYVAACDAIPAGERWRREHNPYWGVEGGYYARYLLPWLAQFAPDNLYITFFEQFREQPRQVLADIGRWLGISPDGFDQVHFSKENRSMNYRWRPLQQLALRLNRQAETIWRAHPRLKQRLRALYFRLNGRAFAEEIDPELLATLRARYALANVDFAALLTEWGYSTYT
jgi:hypothetical protein